jgi:hypothetical protein
MSDDSNKEILNDAEAAAIADQVLGPLVRFRCPSGACKAEGERRLGDLSGEGCPTCGSKRLEVWHPSRGHVLIDWRSQKSVRKRRRRRERVRAAVVGIALGLVIGCTPAPDSPEDTSLTTISPPRPAPAVSWQFAEYDSICGRPVAPVDELGVGATVDTGMVWFADPPRSVAYLAAVRPEPFLQLFRVEWSPRATGDTCFYPVAFPILYPNTPAGIISIRIEGAIPGTDSTRGDEIMFWRSWPWRAAHVAHLESTFCMDPVYGD